MRSFLIACLLLFCLTPSVISQDLRIMTYNIRLDVATDGENAWRYRRPYFVSQLKFYEPDIIGMQEVTPTQLKELKDDLIDYEFVGIGREQHNQGESSNICYKKNKFQLLDSGTFWLSDTPDEVSMGWDAACNRVCTYTLLYDRQREERFYVFNTHLDHIGEVARTKGLELIWQKINTLNTNNLTVFLIGDFNSSPETDRIQWLKTKMDDTRSISKQPSFGPKGTFNGFKHHEPVTLEIDYIFVSKMSKYKIQKHAVLSDSKDTKYPSDHLPVLVEVMY